MSHKWTYQILEFNFFKFWMWEAVEADFAVVFYFNRQRICTELFVVHSIFPLESLNNLQVLTLASTGWYYAIDANTDAKNVTWEAGRPCGDQQWRWGFWRSSPGLVTFSFLCFFSKFCVMVDIIGFCYMKDYAGWATMWKINKHSTTLQLKSYPRFRTGRPVFSCYTAKHWYW